MRLSPWLPCAAGALVFGLAQIACGEQTQPNEPAPAPGIAAPTETADAAPAQTANAGGEKWRYRRHQGLWWYWLPTEKWVYWHEGQWVPYDASRYAQLQRSLPARRYTHYRGNSAYPELGEWGPVRYDSYGNRQYPYSRRHSGIRQLGPVPAMGGVRSLPGWGGER